MGGHPVGYRAWVSLVGLAGALFAEDIVCFRHKAECQWEPSRKGKEEDK